MTELKDHTIVETSLKGIRYWYVCSCGKEDFAEPMQEHLDEYQREIEERVQGAIDRLYQKQLAAHDEAVRLGEDPKDAVEAVTKAFAAQFPDLAKQMATKVAMDRLKLNVGALIARMTEGEVGVSVFSGSSMQEIARRLGLDA